MPNWQSRQTFQIELCLACSRTTLPVSLDAIGIDLLISTDDGGQDYLARNAFHFCCGDVTPTVPTEAAVLT